MDEQLNIAKDGSARFHRELDFDRLRIFMRQQHESSRAYAASECADEGDAVLYEQIFESQFRAIDELERSIEPSPDSVPVNIFVSTEGEAPHRAMTKTGGLPFWPADRPWPKDWFGGPMTFMRQVNFSDSRDLVGELPGDVLVMFCSWFERIKAFWLPMDCGPLIDPGAVPKPLIDFGVSHEVICRIYEHRPNSVPFEPGNKQPFHEIIGEIELKIGGAAWGNVKKPPIGSRFIYQMDGEPEFLGESEMLVGGDWRCAYLDVRDRLSFRAARNTFWFDADSEAGCAMTRCE